MKPFNLILAVVVIASVMFILGRTMSPDSPVDPKDLAALIARDTSIVILDVRSADDYYGASGHLAHAILIPVQALENRLIPLAQYKSRTIVVYCQSGHRSHAASAILSKGGFHVVEMKGGITQWNADQLPVVHESR